MAQIKPLKAVMYNTEKVDISKVIMPPYDIIRDTSKYYEKDPCNIIRIDKGAGSESDDENNNKYTRARKFMDEWMNKGVLKKDDKENIYVYAQEYKTPDGEKHEMVSFFAAVKIEEFDKKIILPHEKTHSGPKKDRLELMRSTHSNTSPILSLYFDSDRAIDGKLRACINKTMPFVDFRDEDDIRYRMWRLPEEEKKQIIEGLKEKQLFIADGHHRYETALAFRNEMREKGEDGEYDYILMSLISMEHSGITILPTHRMKNKFEKNIFENKKIEEFFNVEPQENVSVLRKKMIKRNGEKLIGIVSAESSYILRLKEEKYRECVDTSVHSLDYYMLDASVLHGLLFEKILNMDEKEINEGIDYTPDIDEAIEKAVKGIVEISFLLGPADVEEVKSISLNDEVMPQKSTYFLPKLATGFLINKMGK